MPYADLKHAFKVTHVFLIFLFFLIISINNIKYS